MIHHLARQDAPKARIARKVGVSRTTVYGALKKVQVPVSKRRQMPSLLDPFKGYIRERILQFDPTAAKLYDEIREQGYTESYVSVKSLPTFERWPPHETILSRNAFGEVFHVATRIGGKRHDIQRYRDGEGEQAKPAGIPHLAL